MKNILVTGGNGFLGRHLRPLLEKRGDVVFTPGRHIYDLTRFYDVRKMFTKHGTFDSVFHLAARVGGISANRHQGADFYHTNILMDTFVLDACVRYKVGKVILVGSNCSYPADAPVPFREEDIFKGYPEVTNGPYGIAKRSLLAYFWACRMQYKLEGAYLILANLYGPGAESGENSHVIPALLRKLRNPGPAELWGTGAASRDFLHVRDAARALVLAEETYSSHLPLNIGSGEEITIRELAALCASLNNYTGEIKWDTTKPDGHLRRSLDITRAQMTLNWNPEVSLTEGLRELLNETS